MMVVVGAAVVVAGAVFKLAVVLGVMIMFIRYSPTGY